MAIVADRIRPPHTVEPAVLHRLLFFLKVSRPGLWFQTLWIYLLPTSATSAWLSPPFWLGLVYVTFPLNFLM